MSVIFSAPAQTLGQTTTLNTTALNTSTAAHTCEQSVSDALMSELFTDVESLTRQKATTQHCSLVAMLTRITLVRRHLCNRNKNQNYRSSFHEKVK